MMMNDVDDDVDNDVDDDYEHHINQSNYLDFRF